MRDVLPAWNNLPQTLRCDLVQIAEDECCRCCADAVGSELAVQFYTKLREALPAASFPLFRRKQTGATHA